MRNTIHEQQYNAQLSAADLENEKLTEQASLAAFFFEIRGQDALQKLLNETVEADKKALELTRARYETGIDDRLSVVEAESTLQTGAIAGDQSWRCAGAVRTCDCGAGGSEPIAVFDSGEALADERAGDSGGNAVGTAGAAAGYCCCGAKDGGSERTDRDSVRRLLSVAEP